MTASSVIQVRLLLLLAYYSSPVRGFYSVDIDKHTYYILILAYRYLRFTTVWQTYYNGVVSHDDCLFSKRPRLQLGNIGENNIMFNNIVSIQSVKMHSCLYTHTNHVYEYAVKINTLFSFLF